ncbi:hypothetical protein [Streptomyces capparidis]
MGGEAVVSGTAVTFAGLAETARRAGAWGQPPPEDADIRRAAWWRARALRRVAVRGGVSLGGLLAFAVVALNAFPWWVDALRLTVADTGTARATVRDVDGVLLPGVLPKSVEVTFRAADGRLVRAFVAHGGTAPRPGGTLDVEYVTSSPAHAAPVDDPGLAWGAGLSGIAAAVALERVARRAVHGARATHALVRAARAPEAHPVRYVLLRDADEAWMLLFPVPGTDDDLPSHLIPVTAPGLPPVGMADLRGDVRDGGDAVPWVDGRPVWPTAPLAGFGAVHLPLITRLTAPATAR